VRQLENVIQRHVALCDGDRIESIDLSGKEESSSPYQADCTHGIPSDSLDSDEYLSDLAVLNIPEDGIILDNVMDEIERSFLIQALERTGGNLTQAARVLGMSYRSIRYKVKKLGVRDILSR